MEIFRTAAELGARYPDVVQAMVEADQQSNLMGELGIDRLPQAGRQFVRQTDDGDQQNRRLGTPSLIPGLFDRVEDSDEDEDDESSAFARMFAAVAGPDGESGDETSVSPNSEPVSDEQTEASPEEEEIDAESIRQLNLDETSDAPEEDEFVGFELNRQLC